jgi:DnaJ-class molecular chaperone
MTCQKCSGEGFRIVSGGEYVRCEDCNGAGELPEAGSGQLRLECDDQRELAV